ncbi:MAG: T9SS type A sorting domain-containing protein, partial [bacterium]|nr:T9SS type A sorting domain-containing protein [bacterium]
GNGLFLNIDPKAGGAGNQTSPDVVQPINGGVTFLKYIPGMSTAGIRYFDESNGSRMVYLPFGYEGIAGPYSDSAQLFVTRIISWLQGESRIPSPKQSDGLPRQFILEQNYPNPFNPTTKIRFALPKTSQVKICIFNLNGQKIKTLVNDTITAGVHEISWNGVDDQNQPVASGVYIYRLKAGDNKNSKKLLLIR